MKRTPMKRSAWPRKPGPSVKKEPYQALVHEIRAVVAIKNEAKPRQVPAQGPSVAAPVREPQTSGRGCAGCPRQVAQSRISRVIAVTANSWGVA